MSDLQDPAPGASRPPAPAWRIAGAEPAEIPGVAAAVAALLQELGAPPPDPHRVEATVRTLLGDPAAGVILVATVDGAVVGLLGGSWQTALHAGGRYGVIQELWVDRVWRGRAVGRDLIDAFVVRAGWEGIDRIEVGLPKPSFAGLAATEAFYRANGFDPVGLRMRRSVA